MKPMLAGTIKDLSALRYPVLVTPKLDGIRCLTIRDNGKVRAVSRKLKDIPNEHVHRAVSTLGAGFDGELIIPKAKDFGATSSGIMRGTGKPNFEYHIFDLFDAEGGYLHRVEELAKRLNGKCPAWVKVLVPRDIHNEEELLAYEAEVLEQGFEGVMIRSIEGPYKQGRSTEREGYLLKLKRFADAEAIIIGFKEWLENTNPMERDELGHAKRSSAQAGKKPKGALGAFEVRMGDVEFEVGTGFTDQQRHAFWRNRDNLLGKQIKFKYQEVGGQEKPRFPVFLGFRHEDD